jgi:hypothetical protein
LFFVENMLTAGLSHTAAPLDSRTLPPALPDSRTLPHTLPHTAALPDTAVRSAVHCRELHQFECRTAAHSLLHTAHINRTLQLTRIQTNACECNMNLLHF